MTTAMGAALAALFLLGLLRWRAGVVAALLLVVFEGAVRKWLLPDYHEWVYLAKDVLLIGAYLGYFGSRLLRGQPLVLPHPATKVLLLLGLLAPIHLAHPVQSNPAVALFGLRSYLLYVPLMYLVPHLLPTASEARRLVAGFLVVSLVPLGLGPLQFFNPGDTWLNRYVWDPSAPVAGFGTGYVRVTSTFSYIWGFTTFLTLLLALLLSLLLFARSYLERLLLGGYLAVAVGNLLMTGSRGPFVLLGVLGPLVLAPPVLSRRSRRLPALLGFAVAAVAGVLAAQLFPEARDAFLERAANSPDVPDRVAWLWDSPPRALAEAGLLGYGVGSTHQAIGGFIPRAPSDPVPPPAEGEWERMILEVGPLGFGLVLLARVLVSWRLWTALRTSLHTDLAPLLAAGLLFTVSHLPGSLVFNATASVFYWFLAGLALICPSAEAPAERRASPEGRHSTFQPPTRRVIAGQTTTTRGACRRVMAGAGSGRGPNPMGGGLTA